MAGGIFFKNGTNNRSMPRPSGWFKYGENAWVANNMTSEERKAPPIHDCSDLTYGQRPRARPTNRERNATGPRMPILSHSSSQPHSSAYVVQVPSGLIARARGSSVSNVTSSPNPAPRTGDALISSRSGASKFHRLEMATSERSVVRSENKFVRSPTRPTRYGNGNNTIPTRRTIANSAATKTEPTAWLNLRAPGQTSFHNSANRAISPTMMPTQKLRERLIITTEIKAAMTRVSFHHMSRESERTKRNGTTRYRANTTDNCACKKILKIFPAIFVSSPVRVSRIKRYVGPSIHSGKCVKT